MIKRNAGTAILVFVGIGFLSMLYRSTYAKPMAAMNETLVSWKDGKTQMQSSLSDASHTKREIRQIAETTLGATADLAEHRLRTLLTELCSSGGMSEYVISCREPKTVGNPAANENPVEFSREMRRQPDFLMIETTVTGQGSLESCMHTIALFENQPWLHRVASISVQPRGKDRKAFDLTASVVTIVMPDVASESIGNDAVVIPVERSEWAGFADANPFVRITPPAVVVTQAPTRVGPRTVSKPYKDWVVTGIMQTPSGGEAIFSNSKSGKSMTLQRGGTLLGLLVVTIEAGQIVLSEDEAEYRVTLGESLADRSQIIE